MEINEILVKGENTQARIRISEYGDELHTTRNGYQWSGVPLDKDAALAIIQILNEYLSLEQQGG